jgi:hypothetical protein
MSNRIVTLAVSVVGLLGCVSAEAATWSYHPSKDGTLRVRASFKTGPGEVLFNGPVTGCVKKSGRFQPAQWITTFCSLTEPDFHRIGCRPR